MYWLGMRLTLCIRVSPPSLMIQVGVGKVFVIHTEYQHATQPQPQPQPQQQQQPPHQLTKFISLLDSLYNPSVFYSFILFYFVPPWPRHRPNNPPKRPPQPRKLQELERNPRNALRPTARIYTRS
jgi:hypothetical protein